MEVNHIPLDKIYHKIPSLANALVLMSSALLELKRYGEMDKVLEH